MSGYRSVLKRRTIASSFIELMLLNPPCLWLSELATLVSIEPEIELSLHREVVKMQPAKNSYYILSSKKEEEKLKECISFLYFLPFLSFVFYTQPKKNYFQKELVTMRNEFIFQGGEKSEQEGEKRLPVQQSLWGSMRFMVFQ